MKSQELTNIKVPPQSSLTDEYLSGRIEDIKASFYNELSIIEKIPHKKIQIVAMFALLDSMAQEADNYQSTGNNIVMREFIIEHSKTYDYLEKTEPITLLYHILSEFFGDLTIVEKKHISDEVFRLMDFDWEHMDIRTALSGQYVTIINAWAIARNIDAKKLHDLNKKHKIANLIVQMRNKAIHEMSGLGVIYKDDSDRSEPYYDEAGRLYPVGLEYAVTDDIVSLIMPNDFLRTILTDCIDGYLNDCFLQRRIPFSNNRMTRNYILTWYNE